MHLMLLYLFMLFAIVAVIIVTDMVDFMVVIVADSGNLAFNSEVSSQQLHTKVAHC